MKKLGLLVILACVAVSSAQENYAQWAYARNITVNTTGAGANISLTQVKFPLLVRLNSGNFDFSKASSDGSDIRFTKANGTARLKHHIERWDFAGQAAEIWVLADTVLGNGSTTFKMFFGKSGVADSSNATAVFDTLNNFQAVFHMGEAANDTLRDVTFRGFKGIPRNRGHAGIGTGTNPIDVTGAIGKAKSFLGSNSDSTGGSYRIVTSTGGNTFTNNALNFQNDSSTYQGQALYTISAWVYVDAFPDGTANRKAIIGKSAGLNGRQYHLRLKEVSPDQLNSANDSNTIEFNDGVPAVYKSTGAANPQPGSWFHIAGVRSGSRGDSTHMKVYVNGFSPSVGGSSSISSTTRSDYDVFIGSYSNDSGYFNGRIDEVEFSNIVRDSNWLKLDYETQKPNPSSVTSGALQQQFPSNLTYSANPATYARGIAIPSNIPAYVGIATHFSVSPALPGGLSLDTNTGIITGTPVAIQPASNYSITATSPAGSTTANLSIRVLTPPTGLSYSANPVIYKISTLITNNVPTVSGDVTHYSVSPALPTGLSLDTNTGVISGTPTVLTAAANYTITASNPASSTTTPVNITILAPPSALSYPVNPAVFGIGVTIANDSPTVTSTVTTYSAAPPLPAGLVLNPVTGVVSGTPTVASAATNYTITATNAVGFTTVALNIRVLTPPSGLSYTLNTAVYGINIAIANNSPTVSGDVSRYSVSPALPTGLSLDTNTGVISGTPTVTKVATNFIVTAANSVSSTSRAVNITVLAAPSGLSYAVSAATYGVGLPIASNSPTVTGTVTNYSVGPALPAGMTLNSSTGVISGTPSVVTPATNYTVSAGNVAGVTTTVLNLTTMLVPSNLTYVANSPEYASAVPIHADTPSVVGTVSHYSVSPALPVGLTLDTNTGIISGTPTTETPTMACVVTASNVVGFTRDTLRITVTGAPPLNLHYSANTAIYGVAVAIANNIATVTGTATHFSVSPALPTGLSLDLTTGVISGTPTVASVATNYVVTASNLVGSTVDTVNFTVLAPPFNLSYSSNPAVYGVNVAIAGNNPTVTGTVTNYSVSPALPSGLTLNTSSGVISGTPTVAQAAANYTVKAFNGPAFRPVTLSITVLSPPSALSYPTISDTVTLGVGVSIGSRSPSVTGTITLYSSPSIPAGLALDSVTGVLSGTPTAASAAANYTITASNVAGTSSKTLRITVLAAPVNLSYSAGTAVYGINAAIANNTPTVTGTVTTYSVAPPLPAGLTLNATTGIISGTPTVASAATSYTVTAGNVAGSTTATLTLSVLNPPANLSYSESPAIYGVNVPVTANQPTVTGVASHYSVSPALPPGLTLDTVTGVISGTPTTARLAANYVVTVDNVAGSTTQSLNIWVLAAPVNLSYADDQTTVVLGVHSSDNIPSVTGLNLRFSSSPALPPGLSLDSLSGAISGTPTTAQSFAKDYVITARNIAGFVQTTVNITVVGAPSSLSYLDDAPTYLLNQPLSPPNLPTIQGIVTQYSVAPPLPTGIFLDGTTGYILGTPTLLSSSINYVVTAQNPGGSTQTVIFLGVATLPP